MQSRGFQRFHPDESMNFMLNRMQTDIEASELDVFAREISDLDDWIEEALVAGGNAASRDRYQQAAAYYRGAEFFMAPDHPEKSNAFDQFMMYFDLARPEVAELRSNLQYENGELSVIDIPPIGPEKDVIVACSGFDGLIEEMYDGMLSLAQNGYRVVLYEGPGQGAALRRHKLRMDNQWEKPVSRLLDDLQIESCTLFGLSLGSYLASRAAAFERRAKRLVAWGVLFDFYDCFRHRIGEEAFAALDQLVENNRIDVINNLLAAQMASDPTSRWSLTHGMHTCGGESPFEFLAWAKTLHLRDICEHIQQDSLLLGASNDHLVPPEHLWEQARALINARSVNARMFTEHERAGEHCQVANTPLVFDVILAWLEGTKARDT
ncbi:MAG: hypothetical protein OXG15_02955 [Gammaproteobacteria bacterium]|nr:hypothetical protein [Gammaproteobacteria bacterium]